jgi:hypothetical protein
MNLWRLSGLAPLPKNGNRTSVLKSQNKKKKNKTRKKTKNGEKCICKVSDKFSALFFYFYQTRAGKTKNNLNSSC